MRDPGRIVKRSFGPLPASTRAGLGHAAAAVIYLAATGILFGESILHGVVYYERDTYVFYYPLSQWFDEQLARGTYPLWLPLIFAGYPILADGEIGMLYPVKLLLTLLLPPVSAFVWDKALHYFLAACFGYTLGRVLRLSWTGGTLAGLVFAFSSFLVGQLHHDNVVRSTVWVPLTLASAELALRRGGPRRWLFVIGGGAALGMSGLGLHPQPLLLGEVALLAFTFWRAVVVGYPAETIQRPSIGHGLRERLRALVSRLGLAAQVGGGISLLGLALAAVQIISQYSLGLTTVRGAGTTYSFASAYAVPHFQLLSLLFPYFFRHPSGQSWSLWTYWESTVYVGVVPLFLAVLGAMKGPRRETLFFVLLAVVSLVLAMAQYSPLDLYSFVWHLPGFSFLRAPGRFSLLFVLSMALLSGYGIDWLQRGSRAKDPIEDSTWRHRALRLGMVYVVLAVLTPGALAALMEALRRVMQSDPSTALRLIEQLYLSQRRDDYTLTPRGVLDGLMASLSPDNPRTLLSLVLVGSFLGLVGLWTAARWVPRWRLGLVLSTLTVAVVAADLLAFATGFHPKAPIQTLMKSSAGMQFLQANNGLYRVFVEPSLYGSWGANKLVPLGIAVTGGYSSLEPRRHNQYEGTLWRQDNILLDLMNVRYVVLPARQPAMESFDGTLFHPVHTLLTGPAGNPTGEETYRVPGLTVNMVRLIAAVTQADEVPNGTVVGELVLSNTAGRTEAFPIRVGMDLAESGYDQPEVRSRVKHGRARVAFTGTGYTPDGQPQTVNLYTAAYTLDQPMQVEQVLVRYTYPVGVLQVHGLGLYKGDGSGVYSVLSSDRQKYREVYRDSEVVILENQAVLPRVFVVPNAVWHSGQVPALVQMALRPFDVRRQVLLESELPGEAVNEDSSKPVDGGLAPAEIEEYGPDRVTVRTRSPYDGVLVLADRYDPGWRVWVDGREAPLLRADSLFRGVRVGPGEHQVVFAYDPWQFKAGLAVSVATALAMMVGSALLLTRNRQGT